MRRALDLFFALRPLHGIPAIALYGAGFAWARAASGAAPAARGPVALATSALPLLALLLVLAAVHAANSWRDREGDARNRKGVAIARGLVGRADLACAGAACVVAALVLLLLPPVPPAARALLLLGGALGAAYVAPGIALKERAGLDLLSQALGYGVVAFLLGAAAAGGLAGDRPEAWRRALAASVPYAIGIASVSLLTMIADRAGDEATGQRTLAVRLGGEGAWTLAGLLAWGAAVTGLLAVEAVPALWGLAAAAALGLADGGGESDAPGPAPSGSEAGAVPVNRVAILLQLLFLALLAVRAPWTGAVALALGLLASAYDRARFGGGYPLTRILGRDGGAGRKGVVVVRGRAAPRA